ncbi:MAG: hypothetical protein DWQ36_13725 [Acidobacteria bacterium]|nr:MAG: hypothetical protein DWQ30_20230 [Acidobacteriota bacterium]REK06268.1 MAG: hypothetical protein DWQ36_13725 [Acidobacteriota bacterium]
MIDRIHQELRGAMQALRRRPQFLLVAVLTLALGVAVNVLIFQVSNEVLLRPLPVSDPGSLVSLGNTWGGLGYEHTSLSYPEMRDYRELDAIVDTAGFRGAEFNFSAGEGSPVNLAAIEVTPNLPALLGIQPAVGRAFVEEDGAEGAEATVLLSDRLFRSRFGGDEGFVGSTIELGGEAHRVLGVLPPMSFPNRNIDLWRAARIDAQDPPHRGWRNWTAFARLAPGVNVAQARDAVFAHETVMRASNDWYSNPEWGWSSSVRGLRDAMVRDVRPVLLLLMAAVAVVALVAATNVANLFLSHTSERRRELSVRTAVGASRRRIAGQLLSEALVISALAGVLGVVLSFFAGVTLRPVLDARIALESLSFDWRVGTFAFALCLLLGMIVAAVTIPAALRLAHVSNLRGRSEDRSVATTRRVLVVAQLAVALALMVTAGLVLRSLDHLLGVETGFETRAAVRASVTLDAGRYPSTEARNVFFEEILERVRTSPGVEQAGATSLLPMTNLNDNSVHILDSETTSSEAPVFPQIRIVSAGLFETLRIPLLAGRTFTAADRQGAARVAVVNAAFAERFYGSSALGKRFAFGLGEGSEPMEIVGIVGNTQEGPLTDAETRAVYYLPFLQQQGGGGGGGSAILVARGESEEMAATAIRSAVQSVDPLQAVHSEAPLSTLVSEASEAERTQTTLLVVFAALAALLAAVGVYGVLSITLQQERRNVGLRLALGALPSQVVRWMVAKGLALAAVGLGVGLVLALAAARSIRSQLYEVSPFDPVIFATVSALLLAAALLAAWIPARRAARVDPLVALRTE